MPALFSNALQLCTAKLTFWSSGHCGSRVSSVFSSSLKPDELLKLKGGGGEEKALMERWLAASTADRSEGVPAKLSQHLAGGWC